MSSPREPDLDQLLKLMFQAHPWHGVSAYAQGTGLVNAFIEIVPSDPVKYELDKASGHLSVDRPQRFSSLPPVLYGFVPQTYCGSRVGARCRERTGQPRGLSCAPERSSATPPSSTSCSADAPITPA